MTRTRLVLLGVLIGGAFMLSPRTAVAQASDKGKSLFMKRSCASCHAFGRKMAGPDLRGVTQRRSTDWLKQWLKSPDTMVSSDSAAKALYNQYNKLKMPNLKLSDEEVDALIAYLRQEGGGGMKK